VSWNGPVAEVIVALDLPHGAEAIRLLDRLPDAQWVKVGSILMTREGAPLVRALIGRGHRVFLDLKWHDIPNTVAGAVMAARELGVSMATVHTLGGRTMMEAAAVAAGGDLALVGVTVLTSHDAGSYGRATGRGQVNLTEEARRQAAEVMAAGLAGVVCSSAEVASVRQVLPANALAVVPGIRRETDPPGDQVRVATAREAVQAGATHLVVGRPVLHAADPADALKRLLEEARCVPS
jgi:orotidine-5'-phosphate decarboxylase